jgi:hypothetical protein
VPQDNPEDQARELGIPELTYPALRPADEGQDRIGVSGTDGKMTTTAMLAKIFIDADWDPTVVGQLPASNFAAAGRNFIFESYEYRRAFDNTIQDRRHYKYAADHLDYLAAAPVWRRSRNISANYLKKVWPSSITMMKAQLKPALTVCPIGDLWQAIAG